MITITVSKAAIPTLAWASREPGFLAILAQALRPSLRRRNSPSGRSRAAKPRPVLFAWL